jgi:hypothetical protein
MLWVIWIIIEAKDLQMPESWTSDTIFNWAFIGMAFLLTTARNRLKPFLSLIFQ